MAFLSKLRHANLVASSFAVISAALILASCVPPPKPPVTGSTADSAHTADIGHPAPIVQNSEAQPSASTSTESQSVTPATSGASASDSKDEQTASLGHKPNELVGLSADQVTNLLGKPSFVRHDTPAEVWQYRAHDCVLDVFLYPPAKAEGGKTGGDKEHTVLYYELRSKNAQKISGEGCYGALISANHSS